MRYLKGFALLGFVAAVGWFVLSSVPAQAGIGEAVSDFTLPGSTGLDHSLSDYRGTFVVLEWFNYDCPFVQKHPCK